MTPAFTQDTRFLDLSSTEIFYGRIIRQFVLKFAKNQSFFANPLFLKKLFSLNQSSFKNLINVSDFEKFIAFYGRVRFVGLY